jgi:hypothetical protein
VQDPGPAEHGHGNCSEHQSNLFHSFFFFSSAAEELEPLNVVTALRKFRSKVILVHYCINPYKYHLPLMGVSTTVREPNPFYHK